MAMPDPYSQAADDPTQQSGLLRILQQIQALQTRPLIPDNPLSQLGAALQGASAGFAGQPNPAIQQAMVQRQQEMAGLSQTAGILGNLASMRHQQATLAETRRQRAVQEAAERRQAEHEARTAVEKTAELQFKFLSPYLASEDDTERRFASKSLAALLAKQGVPVPPEFGAQGLTKALKIEDRKEIRRLLIAKNDPAAVAEATGHSLATVLTVAAIPDTPMLRRWLNMPTDEHLLREEKDNEIKDLEVIRRRQVLEHPEADKFTHQAAKSIFNKNYFDLSEADRKRALAEGHKLAIDLTYGKGFAEAQAKFNADFDHPLREKASLWLHKKTFEPAPPTASEREVLASGAYVPVKDTNIRRQLSQVTQINRLLIEMQEVYENRREVFPRSTGSAATDYKNLLVAEKNYVLGLKRDPDIAKIKAALGKIPTLARLAGDVGNLAEREQELQKMAAGLDGVGLYEYKVQSLESLRAYLNQQLQSLGFAPLPGYEPMLRVKTKDGSYTLVPKSRIAP